MKKDYRNLFIRAFRRLGWVDSLNLTGRVAVADAVFKIPMIKGVGYYNLWIDEPQTIGLFRALTQWRRGLFVDVGVNIGQTLLQVKAVSRSIPYIGFEPNPTCNAYVGELIRLNGLVDCRILPVALGDTNRLLELMAYDESGADTRSTVIEDLRPAQQIQRRETVAMFDLPTVMTTVPMEDVSVVKIDVEGAELEVLQTFASLLREKRPPVLVEILPVYRAENTGRLQRQQRIEALVAGLGYTIHRILKSPQGDPPLQRIREIGIHADQSICDYLLLPEEQVDGFAEHISKNFPSLR